MKGLDTKPPELIRVKSDSSDYEVLWGEVGVDGNGNPRYKVTVTSKGEVPQRGALSLFFSSGNQDRVRINPPLE